MVDDVFDIKGAVVVPSTLCCFETERPHLADETALERPTVTAATTETGRARVSTETELGRSHIGAETELGRSHVAAADTTELGRFHVAAGTDLHRTRVAYIGACALVLILGDGSRRRMLFFSTSPRRLDRGLVLWGFIVRSLACLIIGDYCSWKLFWFSSCV
jgi:hypothetical protein